MQPFKFKTNESNTDKLQAYLKQWETEYTNASNIADENEREDEEYRLFQVLQRTAINAFRANNIEALDSIFKTSRVMDFFLTPDNLLLEAHEWRSIPALTVAIMDENKKMVEYLLSRNASACARLHSLKERERYPEYTGGSGHFYAHSLAAAIWSKNPEIVQLVLTHIFSSAKLKEDLQKPEGITIAELFDINYLDDGKYNLLTEAALVKDDKTIRTLLENGANFARAINHLVQKINNKYTPPSEKQSHKEAIVYLMNFAMLPAIADEYIIDEIHKKYRTSTYGNRPPETWDVFNKVKKLDLPNLNSFGFPLPLENATLNDIDKILKMREGQQKDLLLENLESTITIYQQRREQDSGTEFPSWLTDEIVHKVIRTRQKNESARLTSFFAQHPEAAELQKLTELQRDQSSQAPGKK